MVGLWRLIFLIYRKYDSRYIMVQYTRNPQVGKPSYFWEMPLVHSDPEMIMYTRAILKLMELWAFYSGLCFHHKSKSVLSNLCLVLLTLAFRFPMTARSKGSLYFQRKSLSTLFLHFIVIKETLVFREKENKMCDWLVYYCSWGILLSSLGFFPLNWVYCL